MSPKNSDEETQALLESVVNQTGLESETVAKVFAALLSGFRPADTAHESPAQGRLRRVPELRLQVNADDIIKAGIDPRKAAENRTKFGGDPDWVQFPSPPECCQTQTTFYAQLDTNLGKEFSIADAGVIYLFLCEKCITPYCELQYY